MKKTIIAIAFAAVTSIASAQTTTTTTTSTTFGTGTITEFAPGETIVLKESSGPVQYRFGERVTYVTRGGRTITADEARTRIRVGAPVRVSYVKEGDAMLVDRVILDEDDD